MQIGFTPGSVVPLAMFQIMVEGYSLQSLLIRSRWTPMLADGWLQWSRWWCWFAFRLIAQIGIGCRCLQYRATHLHPQWLHPVSLFWHLPQPSYFDWLRCHVLILSPNFDFDFVSNLIHFDICPSLPISTDFGSYLDFVSVDWSTSFMNAYFLQWY